MLEEIVPDAIWVSERPVWFGGVRLRARTTVLRLEDGGLLVHSPAPPTDESVAALEALGTVRWLFVPNCFHHLGTPSAAARYPEATVVGPKSALGHNPSLRLDRQLEGGGLEEELPGLSLLPLRGVPFLDETVLFHHATGSLVGADIALCACAKDHWSWRFAARIMGCYEKVRVPPDVKWKTSASDEAARSVEAMLELPIARLLVAHADPIEERPKDQLAEAWRFVGVG